MKNLKKLYEDYNEILDSFEKSYFSFSEQFYKMIISIIGDPNSYDSKANQEDIEKIKSLCSIVVEFESKNENSYFPYKNWSIEKSIEQFIINEREDGHFTILRDSEPICLMTDEARQEIQGIIDLNLAFDEIIEKYESKMYEFSKKYKLRDRLSVHETNRKEKGLAA